MLGGQYVSIGVMVGNQGDEDFNGTFCVEIFTDQVSYLEQQNVTEQIGSGHSRLVSFQNVHISEEIGKHTLDAYINKNISTRNYCEFKATLTGIDTLNIVDSSPESNNQGKVSIAQIYLKLDKTITVDDDGGADYTKIQDAIDNASDGDTIYVYSGTYYESLQIDKTVTLTGEDKNNTVIDGGNSGNVVDVTADSVNINGFTVRNGDVWDAGIYVYDSHDSCIFDCIISSNNGSGIELDLTKHALVSNCIISSNKQFGVLIYNSDGSRPHSNNNIVSNCIISNNDEGVFIDDTMDNTIMNNDIRENRVYGVHIAFASNNKIKENNFIMNNRSAYFQGIQLNSWSNNYWCYSISGSKIKIILGRVTCFPWLQFDWNPAKEPHDLPL
jgi:parallel beta-helix repeat protein